MSRACPRNGPNVGSIHCLRYGSADPSAHAKAILSLPPEALPAHRQRLSLSHHIGRPPIKESEEPLIYHVRATLRPETVQELLRKLGDGSIAKQVPDGAEIVASMKRAVIAADGVVEWTELCFCPTPLQHERSTVLDIYFDDITTEPVSAHQAFEGTPLMQHLEAQARG